MRFRCLLFICSTGALMAGDNLPADPAQGNSLRGQIEGMQRVSAPNRPSYDDGMVLFVSDSNWTSVPRTAVLSLPAFLDEEAKAEPKERDSRYELIESTRGLPVSTDYLKIDEFFASYPDGLVRVGAGEVIPEFEIDKLYVRVNESGTPISEDLK